MADPQRRDPPSTDSFLEAENERLRAELALLREGLREPEEILRAIRLGEVDGFVVREGEGEAIYQLRSADVLCRVMIEDMKEGAVALDAEGIILYCNRHFARMVKTAREELVGARVQTLIAPEIRSSFQDQLREANGAVRRSLELVAADGTRVPGSAAVHLLSVENQDVFCLVVGDLTRERLQEESRRKDEFLAILGHELRGPLAPIRNAAQLLRLSDHRDPQLDWIGNVIDRQVDALTRMVDDLLDVGRIAQGKVQLEMESLDLAKLLARAVETSRPAIEHRGHELQVRYPPTPLRVHGDPARLAQVLNNLLDNAAKFTPEGGRILLSAERRGHRAVLRVRDNGVGIPPDQIGRIFDLFAQADSPNRPAGGLGIGLSLVRGIVEIHGGTVEASSDGPGLGTEFLVQLPLLAPAADASRQDAVAAGVEPEPGPGGRVLLVDDNADTRDSLAQLVERWGYEVRTAPDGPAAIELCRTCSPDVVLLDIGLPGMNGYDLARRLRALPGLERAALIAFTGYAQDGDRRRSEDAGIDHYTIKPADPVGLAALLASCCRH